MTKIYVLIIAKTQRSFWAFIGHSERWPIFDAGSENDEMAIRCQLALINLTFLRVNPVILVSSSLSRWIACARWLHTGQRPTCRRDYKEELEWVQYEPFLPESRDGDAGFQDEQDFTFSHFGFTPSCLVVHFLSIRIFRVLPLPWRKRNF